MENSTDSGSILDTKTARITALILSACFALLIWTMTGNAPEIESVPVSGSQSSNSALQECLNRRIGDVDRMKSEGILNDSQYSSFRNRAEELCRQQNPEN